MNASVKRFLLGTLLVCAAAGAQAALPTFWQVSSEAEAREALEGSLAEALDAGHIADAILATSGEDSRDFWRVREEWAVDRVYPGALWFDVSAPVSRLSEYADGLVRRVKAHDSSLDVYFIGHLADGNLHVTVNSTKPVIESY